MTKEAKEYVRNLSERANPIYTYLAKVLIARQEKGEYIIVSVDSYPTMVMNENEPTDMWSKKSTDMPPEDKCKTHRIGDALARSISNMMADTILEEREEPTEMSEEMKGQIEGNLEAKFGDMDEAKDTPHTATRWSDGTVTYLKYNKPTLPVRESNKLATTLNESRDAQNKRQRVERL